MKLKFIILFLCCLGFAFAGNNSPQSVSAMDADSNNHATYHSSDDSESKSYPKLEDTTSVVTPALTESQLAKLSTQKIRTLNKIVAYVNKNVITSNQVNAMVQQTIQTLKQKGITNPDINDIHAKVLDQLIMQEIQLDMAARSGIKTNDIEINDAMNNIAKSQNTTVEGLKANLTKQGMSLDDFRNQLQKQIIMEKLKQREVDGRIIINDDEVNRVLNSEAYKDRVEYHLAMITIAIPEQATTQIIQQKQDLANKAYNELKSGVHFDQVAIKYSNAPNALSGGDLGWRSSAALPPQIANSLKDLPVGGYTGVIKLPVGFFIFKVIDIKKHGTIQIVKQYHVRHILIKVNEATSDDEAHQKIVDVKEKLDKDKGSPDKLNTDFIKYAKQYSEDTSSINGGDIGWISKGDTVPAFEQVVLSIPTGVVSDPIRTPFGWHILEVLGVRDSNLTNDKEKADIRQELHESKATMLYAQWIRDIREMAYVKINDD